MKKYKKIQKMYKKIKNLDDELSNSSFFDDLVGKKVRFSKEYMKWIKEHGEECGFPFDELTYFLKRPTGKIISGRYDGIVDGFSFRIKFKNKFEHIVDIDSIEFLE